jgi:hypothetical protein
MLAWAGVSSLSIYPHSYSYFNELVGGPTNGWKHLHNSNVDWGQDLTHLKQWLDAHTEVEHIGVAAFHWIDVRKLGIDGAAVNRFPLPTSQHALSLEKGPQPGWFAISVCHLAGEPAESHWGRASDAYQNDPSRSYFRYFEPVDRVGYSMNIYHVTREDCNRVRRKLGLNELPPNSESEAASG